MPPPAVFSHNYSADMSDTNPQPYTVLMRLGDSRPALLGQALDALHKQISKLPVPYTHKQEEEDEHGLGRCCTALLTFVQPFVQEVKSQDAKRPVADTYHARLRTVLLKL